MVLASLWKMRTATSVVASPGALGAKLCGSLPLTRHLLLGTGLSVELVETPGCEGGLGSSILVSGVLSAHVAETAGLRPMAATAAASVRAHGLLPRTRLATTAACRAWLEKLVAKPAPLARWARQVSTSGSGVAVAEADSGAVEPFVMLTWNMACIYGFIRTLTGLSNTTLSPAAKLAQRRAGTISSFLGRKSEMLGIQPSDCKTPSSSPS